MDDLPDCRAEEGEVEEDRDNDLAEEDNPRLRHYRAHYSQCHWRLRHCTDRDSVGCYGITDVGIGIVRDGATSWNGQAVLDIEGGVFSMDVGAHLSGIFPLRQFPLRQFPFGQC